MFVQILLLFLFTSTSLQASLEEATTQLELTKTIVINAIRGADGRLKGYYDRFVTSSNNTQLEGTVLIQSEQLTFFGQVTAIEELGQSAGVDISSCLVYPEEEVRNLSSSFTKELEQCIATEAAEAEEILVKYTYLTDVAINPLYSLEFQLRLCEIDNEDCITPLYEQIMLEKQYRRDWIDIGVIQATNLLRSLTVIVGECQDLNVSQFVNYVNAILQQITDCADNLISGRSL